MANESTDVLMTFIKSEGAQLPAECASVWNASDTMKTDFKEGCFFEVQDFSFGGGLDLKDGSASDQSWPGGNSSGWPNSLTHRDDPRKQGKEDGKDGKRRDRDWHDAARGGRGNKFAAYILNKDKKWADKLMLDVPEISVIRQMDKCSPHLFFACMTLHSFSKAVLVKRKIIGGFAASGATVPMMGYLRFDFDEPLITSIDWEDGDVIKEKFKFVCRGFTMTYRAQNPDGSLGAPIFSKWDAKAGAQTVQPSPSSTPSPAFA